MDYFLAIEVFNEKVNKFWYGIVTIDLKEDKLPEITETIVKDAFDIDPSTVTIKVVSFNNIET